MSVSTGRMSPGTQADNSGVGTIAWTTPTNAATSNDTRTTASFTSVGEVSHYLLLTNFGFTIPSDAKIEGIIAENERRESSGIIVDIRVRLVRGGVIETPNKTRAEEWAAADEIVAYGDPRDLWAAAWTPSEINSSGFGLAISARNSATAGAKTAEIDTAWLTVFYSRPSDTDVTTIRMRDGRPPHAAKILITPNDCGYAFREQGSQTASFLIPKSHEQLTDIRALMFADLTAPPMVTIEPATGDPWVGFVMGFDDDDERAYIDVTCADHRAKIDKSVTQRAGTISGASGDMLVDTLVEIDQRTPLFLRYESVGAGPPAEHTFRGDEGGSFVNRLEEQTGYRLRFAHYVADNEVQTNIVWTEPTGTDRRNEDVWLKDVHFTRLKYHLDFRAPAEALVIVGTGSFDGRSAVSVGSGRGSALAEGTARRGIHEGSSSVVFIRPQLASTAAAGNMGQAMLDAPENASERLSMSVTNVDPTRLKIGDIRRIRYQVFGADKESDIRVIGIQTEADSGVYDIEAVVVPEVI